MKVKVIKIACLSRLQNIEQIKHDLNFYSNGEFPSLSETDLSDTRVVLVDSIILDPSDEVETLYKNAIKLYEGLKNMDRISGSDQRLWAWLARGPFSKYLAKRWGTTPVWLNPAEQPKINSVLTHWFVQAQMTDDYFRHGLAYLWWGVEMTKGEKNDPDKYVLTKEFFSTQEYTRHLAGELGRSKNLLRAVLRYVTDHPETFSGAKDDKIRKLFPRINMTAAFLLLPSLSEEKLQEIIEGLAKNL